MKKENPKSARKLVSITVTRQEQGATLQDILEKRLGISRRAAKDLIDARGVFVNRQCVWMARHRLHPGDVVETRVEGGERTVSNIRLLAEYKNYLFVDKPVGMLSIGPESLETILREQQADNALRCVHRLDRDTSGCLMVAKNRMALESAIDVFRTRRVRKVYNVLMVGRLREAAMTIETPISGDPARTHIRRISGNDDVTFAQARIETGRTHQIRLHLASIRHPVVGDRLHGLKRSRDMRLLHVPRQMLHASELEMRDPTDESPMRARSPLPADFRRCLEIFGLGR